MQYVSIHKENESKFSVTIASEDLSNFPIMVESLTPSETAALVKQLTSAEDGPTIPEWPKDLGDLKLLTPTQEDTDMAEMLYRHIADIFYFS